MATRLPFIFTKMKKTRHELSTYLLMSETLDAARYGSFYSYTSTYLFSHMPPPPPPIIFLLHLIYTCTARRYNGTCFFVFLQGVAAVISPGELTGRKSKVLEVYTPGQNKAGTRLTFLDYMLSMAQRHSLKTWSLAFSCITMLLLLPFVSLSC